MRFKLQPTIFILFLSLIGIISALDFFPMPFSKISGIIFIGAVFLTAASVILRFAVTRPIQQMTKTIDAIARGDFPQKAIISGNDELSALARALYSLSGQIQSQKAQAHVNSQRLEAVLLSMVEGVIVVDQQERILLMNKTLRDLLSIKNEPRGNKVLEVILNADVQNMIERVLRQDKEVLAREVFLLPQEKTVLVHAAPVIRDGRTEGAVLVFHDITERKRLETMRRDFVANVSHELRTPLTSIKGYSETLLEGALDDKAHARDFVTIIYSESDRLAKLINDLLDLSRIESGKMELDVRPVEVKKVIEDVLNGLKGASLEKSLRITLDIPEPAKFVLADEQKISQVIVNLIDNAIKYNRKDGSITITVCEQGQNIRTEITDTGCGIPEKDLPRIFERFYRVDKGRSRQLGGTGLGLAIVKHIVQAHGGEVFVTSVEGKGSAFGFTLPRA